MFCSRCGAQSPDGSGFCQRCGNSLAAAGASPSAPIQSPSTAGTLHATPPNRSPAVAAFLNLFFGIGYLYLGYRRILELPTGVFVILAIGLYFVAGIATAGIGALVAAIVFAVDGWQKGTGAQGFINAE